MLRARVGLAAAVLLLLPAASRAAGQSANGSNGCLRTAQHEYEVCTAYEANCVLISLAPYYVFAHSPNPARRAAFSERLNSRYYGLARRAIRQRVATWPGGENHVGLPDIDIVSVNSDLAANRATLVTRETWQVSSGGGKLLFAENNRLHIVTMHRVPGLILHKWVVTAIS